jgi:hypothetical protein
MTVRELLDQVAGGLGAEIVVDAREIVEREHHDSEWPPRGSGLCHVLADAIEEARALVHISCGQVVAAAAAINAQHAMRTYRAPLRSCVPASAVLDEDPRVRTRREAIGGAIEHAVAGVGLLRPKHRLVPRFAVRRVAAQCEGRAGRNGGNVPQPQHRGGVGTPRNLVARKVPVVDDLADGGQDLARIERAAPVAGSPRRRPPGRCRRLRRHGPSPFGRTPASGPGQAPLWRSIGIVPMMRRRR